MERFPDWSIVDWFMGKARRKDRDGEQTAADTKLYLEENVLERKLLPDADMKAIVDLPPGLDYNEWLASHTLALFEHVNLVYGTISEFCTTSGCSEMTGPGTRLYLWFDEKGKKTRVAAPQYIDFVMTFTQKTVSDEHIFPTKYANEFPSSFESIARKILRLLFHVIAHLYAAHFREIALLGLHTHLNLTFAHLTALHRRFNLIESKETEVLRDLEVALRLTDDGGGATTSATSASTVAIDLQPITNNTNNNNNSSSCSNSNNLNTNNNGSCTNSASSSLLLLNDENATPMMVTAAAAGGGGGGGGCGINSSGNSTLCNSSINSSCNNCGSGGNHHHHHHHHQQQHIVNATLAMSPSPTTGTNTISANEYNDAVMPSNSNNNTSCAGGVP